MIYLWKRMESGYVLSGKRTGVGAHVVQSEVLGGSPVWDAFVSKRGTTCLKSGHWEAYATFNTMLEAKRWCEQVSDNVYATKKKQGRHSD